MAAGVVSAFFVRWSVCPHPIYRYRRGVGVNVAGEVGYVWEPWCGLVQVGSENVSGPAQKTPGMPIIVFELDCGDEECLVDCTRLQVPTRVSTINIEIDTLMVVTAKK